MEKSIQYLAEVIIQNFAKAEIDFFQQPTRFAEFTEEIQKNLNDLGRHLIIDALEELDMALRNSAVREKNWVIKDGADKELITRFGSIAFHKTYFQNRESGECVYLVDQLAGFDGHAAGGSADMLPQRRGRNESGRWRHKTDRHE